MQPRACAHAHNHQHTCISKNRSQNIYKNRSPVLPSSLTPCPCVHASPPLVARAPRRLLRRRHDSLPHPSRLAHKVEHALRPRISREPAAEEDDAQGEEHIVDLPLEPRLELVEEVLAEDGAEQPREPSQHRVPQQRVRRLRVSAVAQGTAGPRSAARRHGRPVVLRARVTVLALQILDALRHAKVVRQLPRVRMHRAVRHPGRETAGGRA
eukprot:scaffold96491_cov63-Phaeocystis_antarctica.AAC.3